MRSGQTEGDGMSRNDNGKGSTALGEDSLGFVPTAESLPEREALATLLFEMTPQGVVCHDANGVIFANPAAQHLLGLSSPQLQDHPTLDPSWRFVHEGGSDFPWDEQPGMVALRTARDVRDVVVGVVNPQGSTYTWLNVTAKPLFRPGETAPYRSLLFLDDITEQKLAQDAWRLSELRLRRAQAAAHMGSWVWHPKTNRLEWSDEMYRVFGIDRAGFTGYLSDVIARAIHPDDRQKVDESNFAVSRDGRPVPLEYRVIWPDQSVHVIWAEAGEAILDDAGNVVTLSGYAQDITERKRTEDALRASEEEWRSLFDVLPIGVSILDEHHAIKTFNPALAAILGLTSDGLREGAYRQRRYLRSDGAPMPPEEFPSVRAQREQQTIRAVPIGVIKEDGSTVWTEVSAAPLSVPNASCVTVTTDITEQRRTTEAKRESEESYRMLFDSINDALLVSELDDHGVLGRFVLVNDVACRRLGYSREELLSKTPADINCEGSKPSIGAKMRKILEQERAIVEAEHVTKDGRTIPVEISTNLATLRNKTVFCSVARDITERKMLENAVQSERKFIASVLDTVPVGVVTLDAAGLVTSANQRAVSILGLRKDDPFGMTYDAPVWRISALDGTPFPEDRLPFSVVMATGRQVFGVKHAIHWPDGRRVVLSINAAPAFDEQGHVAGMTAAIEDITELERGENELTKSHDLLTNLARLVPSVIYQYRLYPDGRSAFPYASPGMNDIYEVTPEEVRQDATPVFGRLHPEDYGRVGDTIMESARTLQTFYCEYRVILPRQGLRWRWSQAHPERTEDGGTLWHGIISDITERKRAEQEKTILEGQLHQSQKMEAVGRLAGGVAHDFNNMLSAILGHVEMAIEDVDSTQALYADLQEIQTAARRSADLTRQLLAFARKQTVAPKVLDLNQTVGGMLKMLRRLIGEDIDLSFQPDADLWSVKLDPSQIDQILANLCVNARDAIADVGKITIETENSRFDQDYCANHAGYVVGDYVQLAVSDNGSGMDKVTLTRLFEPFFTTKELGKGTGLGLATVYGIVKQNGGFINVYSEPEHGTTFKIYLPRHVGDGRVALDSAATSAARGNETILVVEDERSILNMTKRILERLGYSVLAARAPGEAICLASEHPSEIHLLVTDVVMPEMNGKDLAKQLQSLLPGLKCLFMSGYTADVIAHHGVLDEGLNFIQKPFSKEDLAASVREVLDGPQDET